MIRCFLFGLLNSYGKKLNKKLKSEFQFKKIIENEENLKKISEFRIALKKVFSKF